MKNSSLILLIILLGLGIRLLFMFSPAFKIDIGDFFSWAIRLNEVGFSKFYSSNFFSDYPPGYLYILNILGLFKAFFHLSDNFFYLLLKLPSIIAEVVLSLLVYTDIKNSISKNYGLFAAAFVLFNPAFIFNSSVWGQIDGILALLLYLSVYLLKRNIFVFSSISLGLAFLVKPQAVVIFPLFFLEFIKNFSIDKTLKLIFPFISTVFLLSAIFFPNDLLMGPIKLILSTANQYQYSSLFAYNFWGVIGFWIPDKNIWNGLSYQSWGFILYALYLITVGYFYLKRKISFYTLALLTTISFYFLPTRIHERYLYPALFFLIITAATIKSRFLFILTILLSLLHFLNLYFVYIYYNVFYYKMASSLYFPFLYTFLYSNQRMLSFISLVLFALISISAVKYSNVPKEN